MTNVDRRKNAGKSRQKLRVLTAYAEFCRIAASVIVNSVNSGITRPNVSKIVHNAEKFVLLNILKSELRYCNPFWNGSTTK